MRSYRRDGNEQPPASRRQIAGAMTNIILLAIFLAVDGFLLYVLAQFAREWRKIRSARNKATIALSLGAPRGQASSRQTAKVIPILEPSRRSPVGEFTGHGSAGHAVSGKQWG